MLKGSARSVTGFNIRDAIAEVAACAPDLVTRFGGHAMAAGLSLPQANFPAFQAAFEQVVAKYLDEDALKNVVLTDGALHVEEMSLDWARQIKQATPWGQGFAEPAFDGVFNLLEQRIVGAQHLKMVLGLPNVKTTWDAIAFQVDLTQWPTTAKQVELVYRLDVNHYRGADTLQLMVSHLKAVEA